jgi:type VI secretion system protein ImpE
MNADEFIRVGRLDEALSALRDTVRKDPAEWRHRVFLFQLLSVLGDWEGALAQLNVVAEMNADCMLLAQTFRTVLNCEAFRSEVFAGKRTPVVFGEPDEWVGLMVQANQLVADGKYAAAQELRDKAIETAPTTAGKINDKPFEWIADADTRLGPILEVLMEGKYCWVPFCRIKKIHTEPPADLRDLVWLPAQFVWTNGGEMSGFIPVRYPQTEKTQDGNLRLARRTEWVEREGGTCTGLGQRLFCTDESEYPLLEARNIELLHP